jgi:V/A-type H+/Na+-transporting ATPase subunit K
MRLRKALVCCVLALMMVLVATAFVVAAEGAGEAQKPAASGSMSNAVLGLGAALAIGLSGLATGLAQSKIGAAGAGAITEKPEIGGMVIILLAIPETVVILGFVVAAMIMTMLK